ncbi:putative heavy metal-associated domain, HMA [Medicago truncatula]|uniref:Heavy-metal-associated domain protein n=1 Tax=Medicago truncatula TaxID=3880 RepID=G7IP44_MEDTR|nr:formin-A [Medicago truncatula]AES64129.1 heavy-metal-associated domain protein [Medicago truncatula]RHN72240.1 putative heavy metal-associated domain, HMA [Medicago truncatula]
MKNTAELPICTLKVDFGCTNGCHSDVKKTLQELKGVKTISVDPKQGKVIVVGNVNPMMLIKLLRKIGRKAQLCSLQEPKEKGAGSHAKKKHHSRRCHESSDTEEEYEAKQVYGHNHKTHHNQRSNKMHDQNNMFDFRNQHAQPRPAAGHQHAQPPPTAGNHRAPPPPFAGYQPGPQPPFAGYRPPPPPMSGYRPFSPPMSGYQPFSGYRPPPMPWYQPQHAGYAIPPQMYPGSGPLHGYNGYSHPMGPHGYNGYGHLMGPDYGHYGSRMPMSRPNPMIHYNSYADNYRYTM